MRSSKEPSVRIAEFKAHLSRYLRDVRRGHSLTLLDRETPIARILPYPPSPGKLTVRKPIRSIKEVRLPPPIRKRLNSLKALLEERPKER